MGISLFTGCSYTAGAGFDLEKNQPELWVNLLHSENEFLNKTQLVNAGQNGRSNANIFLDTVEYITHNDKVDYAFVEWTSWPRYELLLGVETYTTKQLMSLNCEPNDHYINNVTYTKGYLKKVRDRFVSLDHPHNEIINIIKYTTTLIKLCQLKDVKIFFINGLCQWDLNFFDRIVPKVPSDLSNYTQKILLSDNRDDEEVFNLYNKIHNEYENAGTINSKHWLNLYKSMEQMTIDTNNDNRHPGIKSNKIFSELFNSSLNQKLN